MNKAIARFLVGVLSLAVLGGLAPAAAQGRYVQLDGRVQWIAGQKLMLLLDYGGGVDIDLAQVPLDQYRTLSQGDRVIVAGLVAPNNRRVYATTVRRDDRWENQGP